MGGFVDIANTIKQPESPIQQLGGVMALKSQVQQQQMGDIQLQQARENQRSEQVLMQKFAENNGDMNKTYADAVASGQVTPEHLNAFRSQSVAAQIQMATLKEKDLTNLGKMHDFAANELESVKRLPVEQRAQGIRDSLGRLAAQGMDISKIVPHLSNLPDFSDDSINRVEIGLKGDQWLLANEKANRENASAPTPAQAQAQTKATLDKTLAETNKSTADASEALERTRQMGKVTAKDVYNQQQENFRAALSRQATFANQLQKNGLEQLDKMFTDPQHGYTQFLAQAQSTKDTIMQSKNGSELASNLVPLMTALGVTSFAGVHRINQTEVNAAGSGVGSLYRRVNSILDKAGSGSVPEDTLRETNALIDGLIDAKHASLLNGANMVAANAGLDSTKTMVMDRSGVITTLDTAGQGNHRSGVKTAAPPDGATGKSMGSDGKMHWTDKTGNDYGVAE